jgi:hypothetical protein
VRSNYSAARATLYGKIAASCELKFRKQEIFLQLRTHERFLYPRLALGENQRSFI